MRRLAWLSVVLACVVALVLALAFFLSREPGDDPTDALTSQAVTPTLTVSETAPMPTQSAPPVRQTNPLDPSKVADSGDLRIAVGEFPSSWNPLTQVGEAMDIILDVMSPRLYTMDESGAFHWDSAWLDSEPDVTVGPEPTTVTYTLNPKAVWSDGSAISADDFQATWQACLGSSSPRCQGRGFDHVTSISQGADSHQVVVSYDTPYPDWALTFARGPFRAGAISDEEWVSLVGHGDAFSGPFRFLSFDGTQLVLGRNPQWWGEAPKLDTIRLIRVNEDDLSLAFMRDEIDASWVSDPNTVARTENLPDIQVRNYYGTTSRFLVVNCASGVLSNQRVRMAVVRGIDRERLAQSDLAGMRWMGGTLDNAVWRQGQSGYQNAGEVTGITYDVDEAGRILDDVGYVVGSDGMRAKDGIPLAWTFLIPRGDSLAENEGFELRAQFKALGIDLQLMYEDSDDAEAAMASGKYQMAAVTLEDRSAMDSASRYASPNLWNYSSSRVNALVAAARNETSTVDRDELSSQIAEVVWKDAPVIPLYQTPEILLAKSSLANFGPDGLDTTIWERVGWAA